MKINKLIMGLVLAFGLMVTGSVHAQSNTPITVQQSGCGFVRGVGPLNCYTVNLTVGGVQGTAWVYPSWILFRPGLEGDATVMATVLSNTFLYHPGANLPYAEVVAYQIATITDGGNTTDPDHNGDADAVTGTITFNLSYGPAGRYGMRALTITSGAGSQSITQD